MSRKPGNEFHGLVARHIWWHWTLWGSDCFHRPQNWEWQPLQTTSGPLSTSSSGSFSVPSHPVSVLSHSDSPDPLLSMWKRALYSGGRGRHHRVRHEQLVARDEVLVRWTEQRSQSHIRSWYRIVWWRTERIASQARLSCLWVPVVWCWAS